VTPCLYLRCGLLALPTSRPITARARMRGRGQPDRSFTGLLSERVLSLLLPASTLTMPSVFTARSASLIRAAREA